MLPDTVIPAFPYEGAFYWFLGAAGGRHSTAHPYYRSLYGPDHADLYTRAVALTCLFDRIILAPADHSLPDYQTYLSGDVYQHPDLRLTMSWEENEWASENVAIAQALQSTADVRALLEGHAFFTGDDEAQRHFLCRVALQIRLAAATGALLIGNDFFRDAYRHVAPWVRQLVRDPGPSMAAPTSISLDEDFLRVIGLEFTPADVDAFATIRGTKEITQYATSFRAAIARVRDAADLENSLLAIMKEAMESERVAAMASVGFESAGSVMNLAGLIPLVGTVASAGGIGADLAQRAATRRTASHRWYLLGAKMNEVALKELLRRG